MTETGRAGMIDGNNTSPEWRRHPTDIVVLPVGAFEQHGPHLSLNTDIQIAEFLARKAAEHLDAALLPALPIATSLEHSAFKGTFSLRPETLMQVIRDIAAEAEHLLKEKFGQDLNVVTTVVNPTIGSHCGPNGLGICFHAIHR